MQITRLIALTAVLTLLVTLGVGSASAARPASPAPCGPAWSIVPSPSPGTIGNSLSRVIALSSTDAWASGSQTSAPGGLMRTTPLLTHWDGSSWAEVDTPGDFTGILGGMFALSPADIWMVGAKQRGFDEAQPMIEHYNGRGWSIVPSPRIDPGYLFGISGTSSTDIWAVGIVRGFRFQVLVEHYDGSSWTRVPISFPKSEYIDTPAIAALSRSDVWIAGSYMNSNGVMRTLIEHYDGTSWERVHSPNVGAGDNQLFDLAAVNADNLWAVGRAQGTDAFDTMAMQYTGATWRVVPTPAPGSGDSALSGVAAGPSGRMRAVGSSTGASGMSRTLTELYMDQAWTVVRSPNASQQENNLSAVAISPDGMVWAVGGYNPHTVGKTLIEQLCP
jgi:hypothetical protein